MATAADVRKLFQALLQEEKVSFHPLDLERIKDDKYLLRALRHAENNAKEAAELLFDIFEWRKSIRANDVTELSINMEYIREGLLFPRGRDVDGCLLMIVKCKLYIKKKKDFEEIKRCIIYWLDRVEREEGGNKITLFLDFEDSGIVNVDLDLINFLMMLFKHYYPSFLNYILVYQLPWLMSPGLKLIKSGLPARAADKMKFVNQDNLKDYVTPNQALTCWGGQDNYVFEFVPEKPTSKKVTFAHESDGDSGMLKLTPTDIIFKTEAGEVTGHFTVENVDSSTVSFKIRTTSPEKFRVRPSSGILNSGASCRVNILVQKGFQLRTASRDKFLVQALQLPKSDMTQKELSEIWSKATINQTQDYQLRCLFPERDIPKPPKQDTDVAVWKALDLLEIEQEKVQRQVETIKKMQLATFMLIALLVGFGIFCFCSMRHINPTT